MVAGVDYSDVAGLDNLERPMTSTAVGQEAEFRNRGCYLSPVRKIRRGDGVAFEGFQVHGGYPILGDFGSRTRGRPRHLFQIAW